MLTVPVEQQRQYVSPDKATEARLGSAFHQYGIWNVKAGKLSEKNHGGAERSEDHGPSQRVRFLHGLRYNPTEPQAQDG